MNGSLSTSENPFVASLFSRKSTREFLEMPLPSEIRDLILDCAIQTPSAGNQALYAIIVVSDRGLKDELADSCDRQAFIAKAPLVLVFVADCLRWLDCYRAAGVEAREPGPGDFLLACEDALIAAQNAVVAAAARLRVSGAREPLPPSRSGGAARHARRGAPRAGLRLRRVHEGLLRPQVRVRFHAGDEPFGRRLP